MNLDEIFWHRLGEALNARGDQRWEVSNLGVGDYGNGQALIALQEISLRYDPDVVLPSVNSRSLAARVTQNDLGSTSRGQKGLVITDTELERTVEVGGLGRVPSRSSRSLDRADRRGRDAATPFEHGREPQSLLEMDLVSLDT